MFLCKLNVGIWSILHSKLHKVNAVIIFYPWCISCLFKYICLYIVLNVGESNVLFVGTYDF